MTLHCGEYLVDHNNDVFNWSANENPLTTRNQKKCKSTRCFYLSNPTIAICSFLLLFSVVSLTIYLGLRQHMKGPGIVWPEVMVNTTTNETASYDATGIQLPYHVSHHSWQYNTFILRAWLGTCLAVGSFIIVTLILLVCNFLWKKHQLSFKKKCQEQKGDTQSDVETGEVKESLYVQSSHSTQRR